MDTVCKSKIIHNTVINLPTPLTHREFIMMKFLFNPAPQPMNITASLEERDAAWSWLMFNARGLGPFSGQSVHVARRPRVLGTGNAT
jgi:hypothetical protein